LCGISFNELRKAFVASFPLFYSFISHFRRILILGTIPKSRKNRKRRKKRKKRKERKERIERKKRKKERKESKKKKERR